MTRPHLIAFLLLSTAAGHLAAETPFQPEQAARAFVDQLVREKYQEAFDQFDDRMRKAMSIADLTQLWQALGLQLGTFERFGEARTSDLKDHIQVELDCIFSNTALTAQLAFDSEKKIAGLFFRPIPSPASEIEKSHPPGLSERPILVRSRVELPGTLTLPDDKGPFPGLVLVHGSGPGDHDQTLGPNKPFRDLAWGLAHRGIAVLRYEKRTRVAQGAEIHTVKEEVIDDAVAAVELMAAQPEIAAEQVFLLGLSLGGTLAPRIATDGKLAGLVILAGAARPLDVLLEEQFRFLAKRDGKVTQEEQMQMTEVQKSVAAIRKANLKPDDIVEILGSHTPGSYWLDLRNYDPISAARQLDLPMLFLQGGLDYQVTEADFDLWKQGLKGKSECRFELYPSLNHLFMKGKGERGPEQYASPGQVAKIVLDDIATWVHGVEKLK